MVNSSHGYSIVKTRLKFLFLAPGEHMDYQFGFTDITTALVAERILFNSKTHRDAFFTHLPGFLSMMPERRPLWLVNQLREKAGVLYPGCRFPAEAIRFGCVPLLPNRLVCPHIIPPQYHSAVLYEDTGDLCKN